ncbi:hypothetical protein CMV_009681 [Castanea mollissima]|uniref:Uncharacterized protein n=1 Tax=Castanea mollissima TaxID=60419 RepID=A0A8J4R592_9ROSI|nr:hypothetical protein CMV_009681 [Castanea mollissima]
MERKELYDALNNSIPLEQELPLEDFGDCELKSKPYVGMQFDSLNDVETFYKEFAKKEGFGIRCFHCLLGGFLLIIQFKPNTILITQVSKKSFLSFL